MPDARSESQFTQYGPLEKIAPGRSVNIVFQHVFCSANDRLVIERRLAGGAVGSEIEHHHIDIAVLVYKAETMLISSLN